MVGNPKGFGGRVLPMEGKVGRAARRWKKYGRRSRKTSTNGYPMPYTPFFATD